MNDIYKKLHNKRLNSRAKTVLIIEEIINGTSLASLTEILLGSVDESDRAFSHELLLGTLRQWWALTRITESLVERMPTDVGVLASINLGLYQLMYMKTPDYAVINDTVEAVKLLDKNYAAGLVNAVLRKVAKSSDKYTKKVQKNHSLPNWLAKQLKQDWPNQYDELGQSLRAFAPIFLRINTNKCSIEEYSLLLTGENIVHSIVDLGVGSHKTIRLDMPVRITQLPKFDEGWATVQDMHAQLAGWLLQEEMQAIANPVVLDMCCAPGGKTTQLLEMFHMKHMVAVDNDEKRLNRVHENLRRLKLDNGSVEVICADGTTWQATQAGVQGFDVILLDAPCTATGVIRRHPDISLLRQEADVQNTSQLQRQILQNSWQNLKVGGVLLYVTCSILKQENEQQLMDFVASHADAQEVAFDLHLPNQIKQQIGYQCLPTADGGDGFYYAKLKKLAS